MSGTEDTDPDLLAAEYVVGCLEADARRQVEAMAAADPAMQHAIDAWATRLGPLAALIPPVAPPDSLWPRLERAIGGPNVVTLPARPGIWSRPGLWRATTVAAMAIAAVFAGIVFLRPPPVVYVAALAPLSGPAPAFLVRTEADGALRVTPIAPAAVADGRDLQLWALPAGTTRPVSLGILPAAGIVVAPSDLIRVNTQILISLEPAGGSPTGQPTGPVLYGGTLSQ